MNSLTDFRSEQTMWSIWKESFLRRAFRKATRKSSNLFLRGRDLISVHPQILGMHEPELTKLIDYLAANGHGDYLIDIGANIGLTSCQSGNGFRVVHMYEPNPLCCHILEVNATIALDAGRFFIHPLGLGDRDKAVRLTVPKHNWGGAFVRDEANSYDPSILASKDGFAKLHADNYFEVDIKIADTAAELGGLFAQLAAEGLRNGVIKIDVEGYEPVVLAGIAKALPPDASVAVIFESWDHNFDIASALAAFQGRATAYKLATHLPWKRHWPKFLRTLALIAKRKVPTTVEPNSGDDWMGDIILKVEPAAG
ncbi:MAG: FkbM family methyltransferase [Bacteroidales bacterium]